MESVTNVSVKKKEVNKGAWTAEEDRKLAEAIEVHGAKRWKIIATKAGLFKMARRIDIHLMGLNRWSLIAGRLPGRTDNEIKNYWNSHLSKKMNQKDKQSESSKREGSTSLRRKVTEKASEEVRDNEDNSINNTNGGQDENFSFNVDDFFDFANEDPLTLEWPGQVTSRTQ
ncbi:hypothetical protein LguiB_023323 [Lonicera macranthoides]